MLLPFDKIETVFRKVHAVRDEMRQYLPQGEYIELNPTDLATIVARMYELKIEMYEVFAAGEFVAGNVERYADGRAIVLVKSQQTEGMVRLVTVKELCHLINDEKDDWSNAVLDTIKEMKVEFDLVKANGDGVPNPSRTQQSELLALLGAIALMYPCEFHASDIEKYAKDETSYIRIGLEHNLPAWAVEMAHAHHDIFLRYLEVNGA